MHADPVALERKAYRPPEVARATGLSRAFIYQLITEGKLRSIRLGRAIVIPAAAVDALLAGEAGASRK
jgi:excisionase family DNA binding protein